MDPDIAASGSEPEEESVSEVNTIMDAFKNAQLFNPGNAGTVDSLKASVERIFFCSKETLQ